MTLKKSGFIYKVAFGLTKDTPEHISLCKLFWRFLFSFFVVWPIFIAFLVAVFLVVSITVFFVGKRFSFKESEGVFVSIPYLHRMPPIVVILISWAWFSIVYSIVTPNMFVPHPYVGDGYRVCAVVGDCLVGFALAAAVIYFLAVIVPEQLQLRIRARRVRRERQRQAVPQKPSRLHESVTFIKAYLKARKDKVCPIITIEE